MTRKVVDNKMSIISTLIMIFFCIKNMLWLFFKSCNNSFSIFKHNLHVDRIVQKEGILMGSLTYPTKKFFCFRNIIIAYKSNLKNFIVRYFVRKYILEICDNCVLV